MSSLSTDQAGRALDVAMRELQTDPDRALRTLDRLEFEAPSFVAGRRAETAEALFRQAEALRHDQRAASGKLYARAEDGLRKALAQPVAPRLQARLRFELGMVGLHKAQPDVTGAVSMLRAATEGDRCADYYVGLGEALWAARDPDAPPPVAEVAGSYLNALFLDGRHDAAMARLAELLQGGQFSAEWAAETVLQRLVELPTDATVGHSHLRDRLRCIQAVVGACGALVGTGHELSAGKWLFVISHVISLSGLAVQIGASDCVGLARDCLNAVAEHCADDRVVLAVERARQRLCETQLGAFRPEHRSISPAKT